MGLLVKKSLQIREQNLTKFRSFEYMDVLVKYQNACIRLVIVYRPPPSEQNGLKENDFFDEFNSLLECLAITCCKLLITGDLFSCEQAIRNSCKEVCLNVKQV